MSSRYLVCFLLLSLLSLQLLLPVASGAATREREPRDFTGGTSFGTTREEIIENRNKRRRQLKNLINSMRKKLADHSAGEQILEEEEKATMERRLDLYARKLEMLKGDMEEWEIERILSRSQSQNDRRRQMRDDLHSKMNSHTEL
eukprot:Nitzschia sp. Nitz4//scaffold2_size372955//316114//316647//NITZ4_000463-RA/size372955-snap-gene-0.50-mRNA-1//1//CDS//3329546898//8310//frame0